MMPSLHKGSYLDCGVLGCQRNDVSCNLLSVNFQSNIITFSLALHGDLIGCAAEFSRCCETVPVMRKYRFDLQSIQCRLNAQDGLRNGNIIPGCGSGEPGVLSFAMSSGVFT